MLRVAKSNGVLMESLAIVVTVLLSVIFGAGLIGFVLSWFKSPVTRVLTYIFASFSILSGVWLAISLIDGNGLQVGAIPVALGVFSIFNARRKAKANV
jgi:hypothetical protein